MMTPSLRQRGGDVPQDASIALIGMPGSGKSTLAVMLSVAFNWPIRESTQYLKTRFGQPLEIYKKSVSAELYQSQVLDAIQALLSESELNCIIVCDVTAVQIGHTLLREFSKSHFAVHVERDLDGISKYLRSWDRDRIEKLQRLVTPLFRSCTNYEYYNKTEARGENGSARPISHVLESFGRSQQPGEAGSLPNLTLKSVERDFMKFACGIRGVKNGMTWDFSSPLAATKTEKRTYTYVVSTSLENINDIEVEEATIAADACEIVIKSRADDIPILLTEISRAYTTVRRITTIPVILHVRHDGKLQNQDLYLQFVRHCLRLSPDYVTINLSCGRTLLSQLISRRGNSSTVGYLNLSKHGIESWHDKACLDIYNKAKDLGFDVVRMCLSPKSMSDNFAIQSFRNYVNLLPAPNPPLIAYNNGLLGRTSVCLNSIMTPVKAPGIFEPSADEEAPCVTARESTAALFGLYVHVPLVFSFAAADVGHTLSPEMHNAAFQAFGIQHVYRTHQCDSLAAVKALTQSSSFGGLSVGPPYKADACTLVDSLSLHAQAIGAINTIIPERRRVLSDTTSQKVTDRHIGAFYGSDLLHGDNTDWIGIVICILRGLSPVNAIRSKTCALVIGAGGTARAAVYALLSLGVQNIVIYNRTLQHAQDLANHYLKMEPVIDDHNNITRAFLDKLNIEITSSMSAPRPGDHGAPTIIISCVPAVTDSVLPMHWLASGTGGVVLELGYESLSTPLVRQIWGLSKKGWVVLQGLDYLPEQGCPQFELFSGRRAPRRLMRNRLLRAYQRLQDQTEPDKTFQRSQETSPST